MQSILKSIVRLFLLPVLGSCVLPQLAVAQAQQDDAPRAPAILEDDAAPSQSAQSASQQQERAGNHAVATVVVNTAEAPPKSIELSPPPAERPRPRILHGFRLGYMHWMNFDKDPAPDPDAGQFDDPPQSPKDALDLASPHMFLLGYEVAHRLSAGSEALNVLLVGNAMLAGLEQSRFLPTGNALIGFELHQSMQLAVGANLAPVGLDDKFAHMVIAAGWTPRSGDLYLPVHVFFIPDVDGYHRMGLTFGVTWERGTL